MDDEDRTKLKSAISVLLSEILDHQGFGEIKIEVKWIKQGHKEVLVSAGKQFRFVVPVAKNEIKVKET